MVQADDGVGEMVGGEGLEAAAAADRIELEHADMLHLVLGDVEVAARRAAGGDQAAQQAESLAEGRQRLETKHEIRQAHHPPARVEVPLAPVRGPGRVIDGLHRLAEQRIDRVEVARRERRLHARHHGGGGVGADAASRRRPAACPS